MSDQCNGSLIASASSSSAVSPNINSLRASTTIFQSLQQHSEHLLAKCISFLPQRERVRICSTTRFFFSASCSPSSWSLVDQSILVTPSALYQSAAQYAQECAVPNNEYAQFSFRTMEVRCRIRDLHRVKNSRLFAHVRCLVLSWCEMKELAELQHLMDFTHLEHIYIGAPLWPLPLNQASSMIFGQLGSKLISFTFEIADGPNPGASWLLPLLPAATLRTLQVIQTSKDRKKGQKITFDFQNVLQKLTQLERFSTIWAPNDAFNSRSPPILPLDTLGLCPPHLPNPLRIHSDFCLSPTLEAIVKAQQLQAHSPPTILCASLIHLRISSCKLLEAPLWAAALPHLSSLHLESFTFTPLHMQIRDNLPIALGERIRTLVIDRAENATEDPSEFFSHCFVNNGLTNLTNLTITKPFVPTRGVFTHLSNLTHLSCKIYSGRAEVVAADFKEFAHLRKLKTLQLDEWPDQYLDPQARQGTWNPAHEAMGELPVNDARVTPSDTVRDNGSLADIFPSLTELSVTAKFQRELPELPCCYDARAALRTIPHLRLINWGREVCSIHPDAIDTYYSFEAIQARETNKLRHMKEKIDACRDLKWWKDMGFSAAESASSIPSNHKLLSKLDIILLSRVFQSLTAVEISRASIASKHWRSAAVSPLMVQYPLRIEATTTTTRNGRRHLSLPAKVHGPSLRVEQNLAMFSAVSSEVLRNMRVISVKSTMGAAQLPRESLFANRHLRSFVQLMQFSRLHSLDLDWSFGDNSQRLDKSKCLPRSKDLDTIRQVIESPALKHLKVFRMHAPAVYMYSILRFLPALTEVEVVELRYSNCALDLSSSEFHLKACEFATQLQSLPSLKHVAIYQEMDPQQKTAKNCGPQLRELSRLCKGNSIEGIMWQAPIFEPCLERIGEEFRANNELLFPKLELLHIHSLNDSFEALSQAAAAMPSLCEVIIGYVELNRESMPLSRPLDEHLASRLRSLKLRVYATVNRGPRTVEFIEALANSRLTNLECLHLSRNYTTHQSDEKSEVKMKLLLGRMLDSCSTHISDLNLQQFELNTSDWERILPQLTSVYSHPAILPIIDRCQQLREFHSSDEYPTTDICSELLRLPHFELVSFSLNQGKPLISTRSEFARQQPTWNQAAIASAASVRRAGVPTTASATSSAFESRSGGFGSFGSFGGLGSVGSFGILGQSAPPVPNTNASVPLTQYRGFPLSSSQPAAAGADADAEIAELALILSSLATQSK